MMRYWLTNDVQKPFGFSSSISYGVGCNNRSASLKGEKTDGMCCLLPEQPVEIIPPIVAAGEGSSWRCSVSTAACREVMTLIVPGRIEGYLFL
jgi:hypothetical protein